MSWLDLVIAVLIVGYGLLGAWSGVIRRAFGLIGLYAAFFAATYVGASAVPQLQGAVQVDVPDAHIYLFFGTLLAVVLIVEIVATLYHEHLQLSLVALNRSTGAALGVITALVASTLLWVMVSAAGNPVGGSSTGLQVQMRSAAQRSVLGKPLARAVGNPLLTLFQPVLPHDPNTYFGSASST